MSKTTPYRQSLLEALAEPNEAVAYLNAGLEDSPEAFLKALRNVAQSQRMSEVAKDAGVQRETLYRSLSETGNPTLTTLLGVLSALGLKLSVEADGQASRGDASARRDVQDSFSEINFA